MNGYFSAIVPAASASHGEELPPPLSNHRRRVEPFEAGQFLEDRRLERVDRAIRVAMRAAERFLDEVRRDDPELARHLRIVERELDAGSLN